MVLGSVYNPLMNTNFREQFNALRTIPVRDKDAPLISDNLPKEITPENAPLAPRTTVRRIDVIRAKIMRHKRKFALGTAATIVIVPLLAIAIVTLTAEKPYQLLNIDAGTFKYQMLFEKKYKATELDGDVFVKGLDVNRKTTIVAIVAKLPRIQSECKADSDLRVITQVSVDSTKTNLCYSIKDNLYSMNFSHNSQWYVLNVFPELPSETVVQNTAIKIAKSIEIL